MWHFYGKFVYLKAMKQKEPKIKALQKHETKNKRQMANSHTHTSGESSFWGRNLECWNQNPLCPLPHPNLSSVAALLGIESSFLIRFQKLW